ncbi:DNA mismatch repair endonuclease MutL [Fictibacillus aquaticus]|uniref:DNA mismatch repair protein MutL n=1 Tax=Fictibacillus aquaticus TaxID=2021314 RepID=A0A235FCU7_9BACL|nr:DNA mismatch repair endonuclease MutL [Fictibacillus aquaticus]OYD58777.1 DNA mismatch repair protein MutL [Fictibacillus aquaticus]
MGKITQLDELLSNKIAAGEVVERPASVVKELVENAIDADSTRIEVELEEGGLHLIRVLDNGSGIEPDDCELAFSRHATSKIKQEQDLYQIRTMGFRGEALPSIASVSEVHMTSSTGDGAGVSLIIKSGLITEKKPAKSRRGTDFIVRNLFFNTPARLKHMKTIQTEMAHTADIMNRFALAYPSVSFRLKHNGREILHTTGNGNLLQVIAAVYGMQTAKQMIPVSLKSLDYEVTGYVAKPEVNRASRSYMSLFMNGRYIRSYGVNKALQAAYHTLLPIGRFPVCVLSITMDPVLIDVNVHPSKQEARLSKEAELAALIETGIKKALQSSSLIPDADALQKQQEKKKQAETSVQDAFVFEHRSAGQLPNEAVPDYTEKKPAEKSEPVTQAERFYENSAMDYPQEARVDQTQDYFVDGSREPKIPVLYPIGQMHGTYIIAQNEKGLYLIDQHAAQERLKYEYFREKTSQVERELQQLTVPFTFEFSSREFFLLEERMDLLRQAGVFLEPFGQHTFMVREHPQWFPNGFEKETIEDIIQQVLDEKSISITKLREKAAIMMSCKGSIKANRHLRNDEIFALLESLRQSEDPYTCPHGRPITVHLSSYELEKMFKRVM